MKSLEFETEKAKRIAPILESLEPLFREATAKKLWFRCHYQGIIFTPQELRKEHAQQKFCWGPVNWELIDPKKLLKDEEKELAAIRRHNDEIKQRMGQ